MEIEVLPPDCFSAVGLFSIVITRMVGSAGDSTILLHKFKEIAPSNV